MPGPRVLIVHQPVDGGVARHVADLSIGLAERGWEVTTCGPAPPRASLLVPPAVDLVPHVTLPMGRAISPGTDARAARALSAVVRRLGPNLVHAHSSKAGALARALPLLRPRLPVLYTPHGYAFAGHFETALERRMYWAFERVLALTTRRVIAVCAAEARLAEQAGADGRVRVVHNGVDIPASGPVDSDLAKLRERGPVVCSVSQLRAGKGLDTLIQSLPALLSDHPAAQLVIVGNGPDRQALSSLTRSLGVAHAVHFTGELPDPLVALRAADVFVLPSWAESFPYAVLEAMAVGLPVVASDVGGIGEAILHGESGLLVRPRAPAELAEALGALLDEPARARRLGEQAARRVRGEFTVAHMVDAMAGVLTEVLGQP